MPTYQLYGMAVVSEFGLPELSNISESEIAALGYPVVFVERSNSRLSLSGARRLTPWLSVAPDACLYEFEGLARMLVIRPDKIVVEMISPATESDMRAYLIGSGFGALAHMRGMIPLHVSAILTPGGVVAFTGDAGAGKSTKVAELHFRHGWPIICDDVAMLHPSDDRPLLHAGVNRIKLWRDAVDRFGIDPARLVRDLAREDKFHLQEIGMFVQSTHPMSELNLLSSRSGGTAFEDDGGAGAFKLLMRSVYRPEFLGIYSDRGAVFELVARTARQIKIGRANYG